MQRGEQIFLLFSVFVFGQRCIEENNGAKVWESVFLSTRKGKHFPVRKVKFFVDGNCFSVDLFSALSPNTGK